MVVLAFSPLATSHAQVAKPAKNLLNNGDFTAGIVHWKGDGKAEVFKPVPGPDAAKSATPAPASPPLGLASAKPGADADRSYCVTLGARSQTFSQTFSVPRNTKNIRISFRVRTGDGFMTGRAALGALQFRLRYPDGNQSLFDRKLERSAEWQPVTDDYTLTAPTRNLDLIVEVFPGAGQLYFDDFVIESLDH